MKGRASTSCGGWRAAASSAREGLLGDGDLVGGNGEAAFGDVEDALGGAAVAFRVVQDALGDPVGLQIGGGEAVFAGGQRHGAGEAGAVEDEGVGGQARSGSADAQVAIEKVLNAGVGRAEAIAQQQVFLMKVAQQGAGELQKVGVGGFAC